MYGGSGTSPAGSPVEPQPPATLAEMLEQLDRAVAAARPQPPRRPREPLPLLAAEPLEQQHLAARLLDPDPRRDDARVVHDRERLRGELVGQVAERPVPNLAGRPRVDEQARFVAPPAGCCAISSSGSS